MQPILHKSDKLLAAALTIVCLESLHADGYTAYKQAADAACVKMKSCALAEVTDASEQMRQMVEVQTDEIRNQLHITKAVAASYGFGPEHEVIQAATACLNSIAALTCDTMDTQTPECSKADAISQKYSADAE